MKHYLSNVSVVLEDETINDTSILIEDGLISAIGSEAPANCQTSNLAGAMILPGFIDLHADALEKEVEPRPGAMFPLPHAVLQIDRRNASVGITTVFHALSFAEGELGVRNANLAAQLANEIKSFAPYALVDNRVHCRYEITDAGSEQIVSDLIECGDCDLISFMDHTPGQGQFKTIDAYREFFSKTYAKSHEELDIIIAKKNEAGSSTHERISRLSEKALNSQLRIASHDDDCATRIKTMKALGANISEFPINLETAKIAHKEGFATLFGAPNIVRGGSQSGNMKAVDAIKEGVASCLCSDYSPSTMMAAIFRLVEEEIISLPNAVRLITANPAAALGLHDRGTLSIGKRADLVVLSSKSGPRHISEVWVEGKKVYQVNPS